MNRTDAGTCYMGFRLYWTAPRVCILYSIRNNQLSGKVQCDITNTCSVTGNHYNETENWMGKTGEIKGMELSL